MVTYLQSLDWKQVFRQREESLQSQEQTRRENLAQVEANGGGFCDYCQLGGADRHPWPFTRLYLHPNIQEREQWPGRYCERCIRNSLQRHLPGNQHFVFCSHCDTFVAPDQMANTLSIGPNGSLQMGEWFGWCFACLEQAKITCTKCGKRTLEYSKSELCWDCDIRNPAKTQLAGPLLRAKRAGLKATLTRDEWSTTVQYFHFKCAYCGKRPFNVLEHYIPVSMGGGTCIENCLPACTRCNGAKGDRAPDKLVEIFDASQLEAIRSYLESAT